MEQFYGALDATPHGGESEQPGGEPRPWSEILPQLTRFYGISPQVWWTEIPIGTIRAYLAMLPRLDAQESQLAVTRAALGTGSIKPEDARPIMRAWDELANQGQRQKPVKATLDMLPALGIDVVFQPPTAAPPTP